MRLREALRSVVFSPDGSRLAVVSGFGPVLLLDRHTGRTLAQVISVGAVETALPVGWTPDGKTLLVARAEGVSLLARRGRSRPIASGRRRATNRRAPVATTRIVSRDGDRLVFAWTSPTGDLEQA